MVNNIHIDASKVAVGEDFGQFMEKVQTDFVGYPTNPTIKDRVRDRISEFFKANIHCGNISEKLGNSLIDYFSNNVHIN